MTVPSEAPRAAQRFSFGQLALYLACGSALAILFSIAVSHILLALAFVALLLSGERLRFPPILTPLLVFMAGTVISLALSVDPKGGRPQIRKFYVFLIILVLYSAIRTLPRVRNLLALATGIVALSSLWSLVQFAHKWQTASDLGRPFYTYYMAERITGFMSHWMTLGGQQMIIGLMATALALFSSERRWRPWLIAALAVILASLALGFTRSVWLGAFCGGVFLLWLWRRWWVLAIPVLIAAVVLANPVDLRERVKSIFQPHGDTDSNAFRRVCRVAGVEMIKAHPWFGLGPEQVKAQFLAYIPPSIPRPLPTGWYGHLHNIYLHYAAERGIPTALALMWLLGKILYDFVRWARRAKGDARAVLLGGVAMMIGTLLVGFFELNLGDTEVLTVFLVAVTCGYIAIDNVREEYATD